MNPVEVFKNKYYEVCSEEELDGEKFELLMGAVEKGVERLEQNGITVKELKPLLWNLFDVIPMFWHNMKDPKIDYHIFPVAWLVDGDNKYFLSAQCIDGKFLPLVERINDDVVENLTADGKWEWTTGAIGHILELKGLDKKENTFFYPGPHMVK